MTYFLIVNNWLITQTGFTYIETTNKITLQNK